MTLRPIPLAVLAAIVALPGPSPAEEGRKGRLAPVAGRVASTHGPFESGECKLCHERSDRKNPGRPTRTGNGVCFDCHDEFKGTVARKMRHPSPKASCTGCHNPHNSRKKKLLL